jgi:hypothetical protein
VAGSAPTHPCRDLGPFVERLGALDAKVADQRFPSCLAFVRALEQALCPEPPPPSSQRPQSWLGEGRTVGKAGYLLQHRRAHTQSIGQLWEATAPGGKRVVLQIIDNLDLEGVDKYLLAYGWARLFKGMPNVLQVYDDWLASATGDVLTRADVVKAGSGTHVTLVAALEWFDPDTLAERFAGSQRVLPNDRVKDLLSYLRQAAVALDLMNTPQHSYRKKTVAIRHCGIQPENLQLLKAV